MKEIEIDKNRRKLKRYLVHEGSLVQTKTYYAIVGQINDISLDGVSFTYVDIGNDLNGTFELSIWFNNILFIENIKCKTISDFWLKERTYSKELKIRRRGVQFLDLKQSQISKIENFIQNNTNIVEQDE